MVRKAPDTPLSRAMIACKGRKGCEFAACMKSKIGKAPKWAGKKCNI